MRLSVKDSSCLRMTDPIEESSFRLKPAGFAGSEMEKSIEADLASLSNRGSWFRCTPPEMTVVVKQKNG